MAIKKGKKKISLKDIAKKAGVSTALVSYVLNGKDKEGRVGKERAKKINRIAKQLNYQVHHIAKSLRSGKSYTIGLVLADISNPFFANIAKIVENEARAHGYTVIAGSSDEDAEKSWDLINALIHRQVDGFIIVSSEKTQNQVKHLISENIPFVLLDRYFPEINTDFVSTDNHKASYDAGIHLISRGYTNIGFIGYASDLYHMKERIRGYKDSLKTGGIKFSSSWLQRVKFSDVKTKVGTAIDKMFAGEEPVEAIIFATYNLAVNGLKYLNEVNINVPGKIAIVSFGQADVFDLYYCPITYVHQDMENLGKAAVDILLRKIKNPAEKPKQVLMEAKLIERDSSRPKTKAVPA
jgi:LacI family transcriptional regulator